MKVFNQDKAFTLIEIMVTVLIFVGIMLAIFAILTSGKRAWMTSEAQIDIHSQIRRFIQQFEELSEAAPGNITVTNISANEDDIIFQLPDSFTSGAVVWGDQIQYSLGGINGQQLVRTNLTSGASEAIGQYITTLRFAQPESDIVQIVLVVTRQSIKGDIIQKQITTQIALRNR
ncbi:MAG: hypothetical protein ABIG64_06570 [Candidatus Omnitrophota bacterium]